jgi:pSer/pThr/pTyr-binding forkhead associated (FHA) protein
VLDDPTVSRRHAEIRRVANRFVIVDVGSTNGLTLNDNRIVEGNLAPGDSLCVGYVELTSQTETEAV